MLFVLVALLHVAVSLELCFSGISHFKIYPNTLLNGAIPYWSETVADGMLCRFFCGKEKYCYAFNKMKLTNGSFKCEHFIGKSVKLDGVLSTSNQTTYYESTKGHPETCQELHKYGYRETNIYEFKNSDGKLASVACDLESTEDGWTLLQRRFDGTLEFYQDWSDYKSGFGDFNGEFWLGLEKMYQMANGRSMVIRFDLWDGKEHKYAEYNDVRLENENEGYRITFEAYQGDAGDSFSNTNGMKFSTFDRDNDMDTTTSCADVYKGGWWFNKCHTSNLNGRYGINSEVGVVWYGFRNQFYSMKKTEVKFRIQGQC